MWRDGIDMVQETLLPERWVIVAVEAGIACGVY